MQIVRKHYLGKPDAVTAEGEIVMRKREDSAMHPYVVHFHNLQDGGYYAGNYCKTREEADAAFERRVARGG